MTRLEECLLSVIWVAAILGLRQEGRQVSKGGKVKQEDFFRLSQSWRQVFYLSSQLGNPSYPCERRPGSSR